MSIILACFSFTTLGTVTTSKPPVPLSTQNLHNLRLHFILRSHQLVPQSTQGYQSSLLILQLLQWSSINQRYLQRAFYQRMCFSVQKYTKLDGVSNISSHC